MASLVRAWPAALSALLALAAFPPLNLNLLVFVALAPWFVSLKSTDGKGAIKSGLLFGFLFMAGQMAWLQPLTQRWTGSFGLSLAPPLLAPLITMGFFALAAWLIQSTWKQNRLWLIPISWAGVEIVRSYCPGLAFPWGHLGTPLWPYPALIQLAWLGGIFLVSGWVALANVVAAQLLSGEKLSAVRNLATVFLLLGAGSSMRISGAAPGVKTSITVGQLGLDLAFGDPFTNRSRLGPIVEQFRAAAMMGGSKLLVLPEGLVRGADTLPPPIPWATQGNIAVLFGGQRGKGPVYQSAFAYDGKWQSIDKTRLVVFGEYVPGRQYLPFLEAFKLPSGDLTPGNRVAAMTVSGIRVGPLLCFEALFPDVASAQARNDSQLLAIMALDDWYMGTPAPDQLRASAVFRAVETGLPVVRAAPLGYSMAVDSRGQVLAEAPLGKTVPMRVELPLPEHPDRFPGVDAFRYIAALVVFGLIAETIWKRFRGPSKPEAC